MAFFLDISAEIINTHNVADKKTNLDEYELLMQTTADNASLSDK